MTSLKNNTHFRDARIKPTTGFSARLMSELEGEVLFDQASRGRYSTDASIYQMTPVGVVIPRHQQDLRLALDIARRSEERRVGEGGCARGEPRHDPERRECR